MRYFLLVILISLTCDSQAQEKKNWTIMHYSVGSNSSETHLMSDIEEMKRGKISTDYHLVTLVDRIDGFSEDSLTLDGNFTDTRLYQIDHNSFKRLSGKEFIPEIGINTSYEANMADAELLKKFIQYCKAYYPADNYLLVLRSHGNGTAMCPDAEGGQMDRIYPGELSDILTAEESVDILGLDVCSMAGLENLYEWRPGNNSFSADYVLASAPLSGAWAYDAILSRLTDKPVNQQGGQANFFTSGLKQNMDPSNVTPLEFSKLIMEEIYANQRWASWGLFDNTKIAAVKSSIDEVARQLFTEDKQHTIDIIHNTLGYHHNTSDDTEVAQLTFPYVDAHHFWHQVSIDESFSKTTRDLARGAAAAIDELVVYSYYGRGYLPETNDFENGKGGVYQIMPRGDKVFSQTNRTFWSHCNWFHPNDRSGDENSYGQYDWCKDGAIAGNRQVENFYELLDFLFDEADLESGGVNAYQW